MEGLSEKVETLRVIAHPARVKIIEELSQGVMCVSDFEESLDISQPNVSQHLSLLRKAGVVDFFMDGRLRCYFLRDPFALDLLEILKKEYTEELPSPACCPVTGRGRRREKD